MLAAQKEEQNIFDLRAGGLRLDEDSAEGPVNDEFDELNMIGFDMATAAKAEPGTEDEEPLKRKSDQEGGVDTSKNDRNSETAAVRREVCDATPNFFAGGETK